MHAPLSALPAPFPEGSFRKACAAAPAFNALIAAVAADSEYLQRTLAPAAEYDEFTVSQWKYALHKARPFRTVSAHRYVLMAQPAPVSENRTRLSQKVPSLCPYAMRLCALQPLVYTCAAVQRCSVVPANLHRLSRTSD